MYHFPKKVLLVIFLALYGASVVSQTLANNTLSDVDLDKIRVTISFQDVTLKQALERIRERASVSFAYNENEVNMKKVVSASFRDNSLRTILASLLHPNGVDFQVKNNIVLLSPRIVKPVLPQRKNGSIKGRIYDKESGEGLPGASVMIEGTAQGTTADANGNFNLPNIMPGKYNLTASFIGYQAQRMENIEVTEGAAATLNIALSAGSENLNEVVVVGDVDVRYTPIVNSTEISLLSEIRDASLIVTGISNQQITRSLDRDAGDVVRRIPGVSILDNFVLIRGMDPRYNLTMLNGMVTPSSEMDTRAFSYNLVPSGVIDRIMAYKTAAPELPGNFGGGVVKVYTKNTNVARRIQIGFSGQYRTGGSSFSDYTTYNGSGKDWYGGGVKDRKMPGLLTDPSYSLPAFDQYPGEVISIARQLKPVRTPEQGNQNFDKRLNINYYDSWKLGGVRLSNLTSANYSKERQFIRTERLYNAADYFQAGSEGKFEFSSVPSHYWDSLYSERVRISFMENLSLKINDHHQLEVTSFFNRNGVDDVLNREGSIQGDGDGRMEKIFHYQYNVRDLSQVQIGGAHTFGTHLLEWSAGVNRTHDDTPDMQRYIFQNVQGTPLWYPSLSRAADSYNTRINMETREDARIYQLNYTKRFNPTPERPAGAATLKAGAYLEQREREFFSSRYIYMPARDSRPMIVNATGNTPWKNVIDTLFSDYLLPDLTGVEFKRHFDAGRYAFDDEVRAGYVAFDLPLLHDKLKIHGGVRYEWNERFVYDANGNTVDSIVVDPIKQLYQKTPDKVQDFILPSVNVSYNFTDKTLARIAYGRTIDRPQFREQTDFSFFDYLAGATVMGNPMLKNATLHNYDLRVEHYPTPSEFIAVGIFYKRINNAIEKVDYSSSGLTYPIMLFVNSPQADIYGVELEVRKNLGLFHNSLRSFSVILNGALLKSKVTIDQEFSRPLQGTSPYLVNLGLYYDREASGTKVTLLYNVAGSRMRAAPDYRGGLFEKERHVVDLTFTQRLTNFLELKCGVQNLLNAPYVFFRDENRNEKYDPGAENVRVDRVEADGTWGRGDYTEYKYKDGGYFSVGFNLTF